MNLTRPRRPRPATPTQPGPYPARPTRLGDLLQSGPRAQRAALAGRVEVLLETLGCPGRVEPAVNACLPISMPP